MEAVDAAASLIALVQTSISIAKARREVDEAIREALKAIRNLVNKVILIQSLTAHLLAISPELDASDSLMASELRSVLGP